MLLPVPFDRRGNSCFITAAKRANRFIDPAAMGESFELACAWQVGSLTDQVSYAKARFITSRARGSNTSIDHDLELVVGAEDQY